MMLVHERMEKVLTRIGGGNPMRPANGACRSSVTHLFSTGSPILLLKVTIIHLALLDCESQPIPRIIL